MDSSTPCISISIVVPTGMTSHHDAVERIIRDAVQMYTNTEYPWYTTTIHVEHANNRDADLGINVVVSNTTNYDQITIRHDIWSFICRVIMAATTKPWDGANATVEAIVVLPKAWTLQMITDFYDDFYEHVESAYSKITIGQIKIVQTDAVPGQSVIAMVRNASKLLGKDAENAIQNIGEMICTKIKTMNKLFLL